MKTDLETYSIEHLQPEHDELRAMYEKEFSNGHRPPYLYERLLPGLRSYTRAIVDRKLNLLAGDEMGDGTTPLEVVHQELNDSDKHALSAFFDMQVRRAHFEAGSDDTHASESDDHLVANYKRHKPIVVHELIEIASKATSKGLDRRGAVFIDVDGTKSIVDCTSYVHAGRYLKAMAQFLGHLPPDIQEWMNERKLKTDVCSFAGDEFILMVQSEELPVTQEDLDALGAKVQQAIADSEMLASFVSFDDPELVMEADHWPDEDREKYEFNPTSMEEKLKESRDKLPEKFTPSVSYGAATFLEGLREALSPHTEEANTLDELGTNAFHSMVELADAKMERSKREFRVNMTDERQRAWLLRNKENRELDKQNRTLQAENDELRARVAALLEAQKPAEWRGYD